MKQYVYKIERISDGKFSNGGSSPSFTKSGKLWLSENSLKSHLRMIKFTPEVYDGCKIRAYEMVATDEEPFNLFNIIESYKSDKIVAKLSDKKIW